MHHLLCDVADSLCGNVLSSHNVHPALKQIIAERRDMKMYLVYVVAVGRTAVIVMVRNLEVIHLLTEGMLVRIPGL